MSIKVLLYEDNESLRNSVKALLQWDNDFELVVAMPDASTVQEDMNVFMPDVILMDLDMPGTSGVQAVQAIRKAGSEVAIIMFTVFEDDKNIFDAICAGANGYLLKKNIDQVPAAIKDVLDGGAPMTSSVAKKVLSFIPQKKTSRAPEIELLSPREKQVMEYVVKGYSYKMIAAETHISVETVRSHIKKIYKKLQVNSATEAIYKLT